MSLWKIAWRSMQRRALSSALTGFSMAIGVALVIAVLVVHQVITEHFSRGAQGYHLIVGAKGGKLQLVLNTVYHLSQPIENIPYSYYKKFVDGEFAGYTKAVIPCCLGDSYVANGQAFRVVGTTPDLFDKIEYDRDPDGTGHFYAFQPGGRNIKPENFYEAVIGSVVAAQSGKKVGEKINPAHGIVEPDDELDEHDAFTIVGILEPTGTPNDRAVFVNMEGFYKLDNHAKAPPEAADGKPAPARPKLGPNDPLPEDQREVTALLVLLDDDAGSLFSQLLFKEINKGNVAQAVYPTKEIEEFLGEIVGPMQYILLIITAMIIVVASIGIMVSIYNSMNERSHEIAVMRALGAGRSTVMTVILLESILLSVLGGLGGILLGHAIIGVASPFVVARTGISLNMLEFSQYELGLIVGLIALASLVGIVPAAVAYKTDVAKALSSTP